MAECEEMNLFSGVDVKAFQSSGAEKPSEEVTLEIVASRVFGKQGIVYVERGGNPESLKWYWEKGKIKFDSPLTDAEILTVIKELWSRR